MDAPLLIAACGFSVVAGANDGSTMVAMNLDSKAFGPVTSILLLVVAIAVGPLLLGTGVATTLARGLVSFEGRDGPTAFLVAVVVAIGVIWVLASRGLPTSLTLSLTGAIIGAGLGSGLAVGWGTVIAVLAIGLLSPLVSLVIGALANRWLQSLPLPVAGARTKVRLLQGSTFFAQAIAYASNDAQKMIAIMALGLAPVQGVVQPQIATQALIGGLFALGILLGVRRFAGRLGQRVMPVRSGDLVSARFAASCAVLASAALGAPVSMTQSSTAGLVGAGASEHRGRVRWNEALRIGMAWLVTLPAAVVGAALITRVAVRAP
jgi:inorganic phosphate transporter, PiT family